jgi:cysteinyl-tRNA synthetase
LYKLVDPAILIKQREEKAAIAADKAAKKAANAAAAEQQKKAQLEKGRVPPSDMFKPPHSELYSAWDENGLPTKDAQGSDVSKAGGKKLLKEYKTQEKAHEAFLAWEKEQ